MKWTNDMTIQIYFECDVCKATSYDKDAVEKAGWVEIRIQSNVLGQPHKQFFDEGKLICDSCLADPNVTHPYALIARLNPTRQALMQERLEESKF